VGSGWKVLLYSRTEGPAHSESVLDLGQALRLFSPEAGAFLTASANPAKLGPGPKREAEPFLKHVLGGDHQDQSNHGGKQLWALERRSRLEGGHCSWADRVFRIKVPTHLPTYPPTYLPTYYHDLA
jgi:hypothetical protein